MLSSEQSYKRKLQEAYLAMELETRYTKKQILESYLNTIFLGGSYYGVRVAAYGYFGKELDQLTLRECAMLAGLTRSPNYYNPRSNFYTRNTEGSNTPDITNNRTDYVLRQMRENGLITAQQYNAALDRSTASVLEKSPASTDMYAYPHYVEYAISDVVDTFLDLNGLEDTSANRYAMENKLRTGGYSVYLCLDTEIQEIVEDTLANWSDYPRLRDPSDKVYQSRNADGTYTEIEQPQAAACVFDYRTGELKAIVGGRYKPTTRKTLNRASGMNMPVGSSIKPLTVYAPAIDLGASPASIAYNMPVPISGWKDSSGKDSWPKNYGGGGYKGPQSFRSALRNSYNTAAAQILMTYVGVSRSVEYLHLMGIPDKNINADPFGLRSARPASPRCRWPSPSAPSPTRACISSRYPSPALWTATATLSSICTSSRIAIRCSSPRQRISWWICSKKPCRVARAPRRRFRLRLWRAKPAPTRTAKACSLPA